MNGTFSPPQNTVLPTKHREPSTSAEPATSRLGWLLLLLALLVGQTVLTLRLFGPDDPLRALGDDRPILSGQHPLHLYHGLLGAQALREHSTSSCFDPSFHAGYPKTPVFDSGSRPAELLLTLGGGSYPPGQGSSSLSAAAVYKIGHALLWALVPLLVFLAARSLGLTRLASTLASFLAGLVWWGTPCQQALHAGEVDLLLAAPLVLCHSGLLIRYHRAPGLLPLAGLLLTGTLGWFAHPLLFSLLIPLFLVYYLSIGPRHRFVWHLALWFVLIVALAANTFWLWDWLHYWWIRAPTRLSSTPITHRDLQALWDAPLWGAPADRALTCFLILSASVGVLIYNGTSRRATARILGMGWAGFLSLAILGTAWQPLSRLGATRLLVPALLFACLPAAHALAEGCRLLGQRLSPRWLLFAATSVLAAGWFLVPGPVHSWSSRLLHPRPFSLGLNSRQRIIVSLLRAHTTPEARILWEDQSLRAPHRSGEQPAGQAPGPALASSEPETQPYWTVLLPLETERSFIGGLDPSAGIEHTAGGLLDGTLAGRPLAQWTDQELRHYCDSYNIGWVVCWTQAAQKRLAAWKQCTEVLSLPSFEDNQVTRRPGNQVTSKEGDPSPGLLLFRIERPRSYALVGQANWLTATARGLILSDVVPAPAHDSIKEGQVVLSLHYQEGMRVTPGRVRLERDETYTPDTIPFVRLRMAHPVACVTITWEKP
jgi:hypothetical protein